MFVCPEPELGVIPYQPLAFLPKSMVTHVNALASGPYNRDLDFPSNFPGPWKQSLRRDAAEPEFPAGTSYRNAPPFTMAQNYPLTGGDLSFIPLSLIDIRALLRVVGRGSALLLFL